MELHRTADAPRGTRALPWWVAALLSLVGLPLGLLLSAVASADMDPAMMGSVAAVGTVALCITTVVLGVVTRGVLSPVACCASFLAIIWLGSSAEQLVFVSDRDTPGRPQIFAVSGTGGSPDRLTAAPGYDDSPALSSTKRLAFTRRIGDREQIYLADDKGGGVIPLPGGEGHDHHPAWSPDGRWLAFASDRGGDWDIYVAASDGTQLRDLTRHPGRDDWPTWSPDGRYLAFSSDRGGQSHLFIIDSDGDGTVPLDGAATPTSAPSWSPDGQHLAFVSGAPDGNTRLCTARTDGSQWHCLTPPGQYDAPSWSPSGSRLAYVAACAGGKNIFVIPADGGTARNLTPYTSIDGAPTWTRSGPGIFNGWLRLRRAG